MMFLFASGWFGGDPHLTTLDNKAYTFNGLGEFTLIKANDFTLQGRTQPVRGSLVFTSLILFKGLNTGWHAISLHTD